MIEPVMYLAIGFLLSALCGLAIMPLVHNRAVRLTVRRIEATTPLSMAEIQADKDQMRAEFAMSACRFEMGLDQLRNKNAGQLAELGKKGDIINRLQLELEERNEAIAALEARVRAEEKIRAEEKARAEAAAASLTALVQMSPEATEGAANAILRDRINSIASAVAKVAIHLEGPDSPIETLLKEDSTATGASQVEGKATLAERIRALQTSVPAAEISQEPEPRQLDTPVGQF